MAFKSNEKRRAELEVLRAFIESFVSGQRVSWLDVEAKSSVPMDVRGRGLFRVACRQLGRDYIPLPGRGVEMSSGGNALEVANRDGRKLVKAVGVARRRADRLIERHETEMPDAVRGKLNVYRAQLGALEAVRAEGPTLDRSGPKRAPPALPDVQKLGE